MSAMQVLHDICSISSVKRDIFSICSVAALLKLQLLSIYSNSEVLSCIINRKHTHLFIFLHVKRLSYIFSHLLFCEFLPNLFLTPCPKASVLHANECKGRAQDSLWLHTPVRVITLLISRLFNHYQSPTAQTSLIFQAPFRQR